MKILKVVVLALAITLPLTLIISSESISQEMVIERSQVAHGHSTEKTRQDALYYKAGDIYYSERIKCMYQENDAREQCQNVAKDAYDVTTRRIVKYYKAEAVYYTSKMKCRSLTGGAKEVCQKTAKHAYDTTMRNTEALVGVADK